MQSKSKFLVLTLFCLLTISACSALPQITLSPTLPSGSNTTTPLPTQSSKAYTATPPLATETPIPSLSTIQMLSAEAGWAWSTTGRLLQTADGGKTWIDRTPEGFQFTDTGFFLDAHTAWLPIYLQDSNRFGLLHTTDGGQSWAEYPQGPPSGLHFTDALTGWAVSGDVGAGNV